MALSMVTAKAEVRRGNLEDIFSVQEKSNCMRLLDLKDGVCFGPHPTRF